MVYPIKCCSFNSPGARHFKKHLTFKKSDWFQVPPISQNHGCFGIIIAFMGNTSFWILMGRNPSLQ